MILDTKQCNLRDFFNVCTYSGTCVVSTWFSTYSWIVSTPHSVPVYVCVNVRPQTQTTYIRKFSMHYYWDYVLLVRMCSNLAKLLWTFLMSSALVIASPLSCRGSTSHLNAAHLCVHTSGRIYIRTYVCMYCT